MDGGFDPVEMQKRSAAARKRNRERSAQDIAAQLEQAGLKLLADPETPAYLKVRLLARLGATAAPVPELDIGSAAPRGVSLAAIASGDDGLEHGRNDGDDRHDEGGPGASASILRRFTKGLPVERSGSQGPSGPPEISTPDVYIDPMGVEHPLPYGRDEHGQPRLQHEMCRLEGPGSDNPMALQAHLAAIQTAKERARPDPDARPWESWRDDDYWH